MTIDGEKASVSSIGDDVLLATAGSRVFVVASSARSVLVAEGAKGSEEVLKTVAASFSESVSKHDL